jgi:transcriptional regulator with XRE-family HTH domain
LTCLKSDGMMAGMTADDLGPKIRRARQRKRWSQQRLADEVGVALRTVGAWERGEAFPRHEAGIIDALETALDVSLTGDEPDEDPEELQQRMLKLPAEAVEQLVAAYRSMNRRTA